MNEHNAPAVQAAAEAVLRELGKHFRQDDERSKEWVRSLAFDLACAAVDAATPGVLTAARKVITEDRAREIMQATIEAQKHHLMAEVAKVTDEALESGLRQAQVAERESIARLADDRLARYPTEVSEETGLPSQWCPFGDLVRELEQP